MLSLLVWLKVIKLSDFYTTVFKGIPVPWSMLLRFVSISAPLPHAAATWLDSDDEALFALANPTGLITLIKLGNLKGIVTSNPLKSASYLGRLWGNLGGMLTRTGPSEGGDAAMSLVKLMFSQAF